MTLGSSAWLPDDEVKCEVLQRGAYFSHVQYSKLGVTFQVYVDNQDIIFIDEETDALL